MKYGVLLGSLAVLMTGCVGTPGCDDADVEDTIVEIITEDVGKAVWGQELLSAGRVTDFDVVGIKTIERDEGLDTYGCGATLNYQFDGAEQTAEITYETISIQDTDEFEVTVYGTDDVKFRIMALAMSGGG